VTSDIRCSRSIRQLGPAGLDSVADADATLEALDPRERTAFGVVARRDERARDHQLEVQSG
jgi:hypothetical protein